MTKSFLVDLEVFPYHILFHFGDRESLIKKLKYYKADAETIDHFKEKHLGRGYARMDQRNQTVIWMPKVPETTSEYGTLQHEIFHAVCFIMQVIGINLTEDSDEAFAYSIGYITKKVYQKIN